MLNGFRMPTSPERQKKPILNLLRPESTIELFLAVLLGLITISFLAVAFYTIILAPALLPAHSDPISVSPTPTPTITQTPSPTEPPTATPTDTATATVIPTATRIPEPTMLPPGGVPKPPDTTDNIHVAQIFTAVDTPADEIGNVDLVWGSTFPDQPPGVFNLYYFPFDRDGDYYSHGQPLTWFLANHADWIEYTCDKKTPAYEYGDPNVPLDITNPAVIDYMMQTYLLPAVQKGYQGIAFDNVDFSNYGGRCGVWKNGNWIKQTNYVGDVLTWAAYMYKALHALNVSIAMNFPFDFNYPRESYQIFQYLDIAVDERGFINRRQKPDNYLPINQWLTMMEGFQYLNAHGKGFVSINEMPEPFDQISQAGKQWVLANYLLAKGQYSYITIAGNHGTAHQFTLPEYSALIGHPLGPMYQSQGVYMRDYSNGLAIVNPSSFNQTFTIILSSGVYQDLYGNKTSLLTLEPQTGIVLLGKTKHKADLFSSPDNSFLNFSPDQTFPTP